MSKELLVIGGTRLFGIALVRRCLAAGHRVTLATRGRAADPFGDQVRRIVVDRSDRRAMASAFAGARYDLVYDQVCYTANDAAIAAETFAGRVARYVMASTIEVYRPQFGAVTRPFDEDDAVLSTSDSDDYGTGKRAAEVILAAALPAVRVRIGHVLAGPEDFTGRLVRYVQRARAGAPLRHSSPSSPTSFIGIDEISALLAWVGEGSFVGALNAASHAWSAVELHRRVAGVLGVAADFAPMPGAVPPTELSPFDYAAPYAMNTARATGLGYRFSASSDWLDAAIHQHAAQEASRAR